MKKNKIIWVILGVILLGLIIYLSTRKVKEFNDLDFPITNVVTNKTSQEFLAPIIKTGLYELKIDLVYVIIQPISSLQKSNGLGDENFELKATLVGNRTQYIIYVGNMDRTEAINVISHELIHLSQYYSGKLIKTKELNSVEWNGEIYDVTKIPYMERPWEIEAFNKEKELASEIRNLLLN